MNDPRQACKNVASGKYFLFIEETEGDELLLVIPTGETKSLDKSLSREIEEVNIADLLNNGLLTIQQVEGYKKFVEEDSIRLFKEMVKSFGDAGDLLEKLKIAQKVMSKVQYEFAINRWAESVRQLLNVPDA